MSLLREAYTYAMVAFFAGLIGSQFMGVLCFATNRETRGGPLLAAILLPFGFLWMSEVYEKAMGFRYRPLFWACWIGRVGGILTLVLYLTMSALARHWVDGHL